MKYHPKTRPFKHQSRATLRAVKARNYAIFFEPRLGKSKAALDTVGIHALRGDVRRVLILAPRIALEVWEQQIIKHFPYRYRAETFDEEWASDNNPFVFSCQTRFFLAGREETFRRERSSRGYVRTKQKVLEEWSPDLIIVDESHEYKRASGVGAQDCWRLVRRLRASSQNGSLPPKPWVLLLSGTPNPKGWIDLFAQFRIMDETIFGSAIASFRDKYIRYGVGKRRWTILGYNKEELLEKKVRAHSISVSAEEAGLANKQFYETLKVQMPPLAMKAYLEMASELVAELEDGNVLTAKNAGVKRIRLLQLCGGFTTEGSQVHGEKLRALQAYLHPLLEQGESVVVYCRFTPEVEHATDVVRSLGYHTWRVDGSTTNRDRSQAIASLATKPKAPTCVVFQHQAGSRAIELVGAAEVVYYSCPDGWVDYFQTTRRVQGPNQHRPVRYTHLIVPGTVDVSVLRSLKKKEDQHAALMRNPKRYLHGL